MTARLLDYLLIFALIVVAGIGAGLGLTAAQRHHELAIGLDTGVPSSCAALAHGTGDSCKSALTSEQGKLMGIPVAIWGVATMTVALATAAVFAGALTLGAWQVAAHVFSLLVLWALINLAGTLMFLYVGLVQLQTKCTLCLAMHAANAVLCIVVGWSWSHFGDRLRDLARQQGPAWKKQVGATMALSIGFWFIACVGTDFYFAEQATRLYKKSKDNQALITARGEVMLRCPAKDCMPSIVGPTADLPPTEGSLVLTEALPGKPTLVEMLDVSCPHCRHDFKERMGLLYRRWATDHPGSGVRLVLWPASNECNPRYAGQHLPNCEANAGLLCAWQHSPNTGLDYLDEETGHAHEQVTFDRKAWLRAHANPAAVACYDKEVDGGYAGLKKQVEAAWMLKERAQGRNVECRTGLDVAGKPIDPGLLFWCFAGTPSYAVFSDRGVSAGVDRRVQAAQSLDKWSFLGGCVN